MSINYQRDGSVLFVSDADGTTQLQPSGQTPAQIQAAYTAFQNTWPVSWWRATWQAALDAQLDNNFDLKAFIRAGTSTTITGTNVGSFLATINNNYRSLRAQIAAASTVSAVQAINVASGWPANP